MNLLLLGF